jgi:hypothetical protein
MFSFGRLLAHYGIGPGKQLADTLAIVTTPVLSQLDGATK